MRVLSIDWDYFVEENPILDFGHKEDSLFLDVLWQVRRNIPELVSGQLTLDASGYVKMKQVDLTELLPFRGSESEIYSLPCLQRSYRVAVAESHAAILQLLSRHRNLEIANIDAHHDIYYGKPSSNSNCGNWGANLVLKNKVKEWSQFYPAWRQKFPEPYVAVASWLKARGSHFYGHTGVTLNRALRWRKVDWIFVCRSGCWTPPEYDVRFNTFCEMLGGKGLSIRSVQP